MMLQDGNKITFYVNYIVWNVLIKNKIKRLWNVYKPIVEFTNH